MLLHSSAYVIYTVDLLFITILLTKAKEETLNGAEQALTLNVSIMASFLFINNIVMLFVFFSILNMAKS